jgi:hypothetical protein
VTRGSRTQAHALSHSHRERERERERERKRERERERERNACRKFPREPLVYIDQFDIPSLGSELGSAHLRVRKYHRANKYSCSYLLARLLSAVMPILSYREAYSWTRSPPPRIRAKVRRLGSRPVKLHRFNLEEEPRGRGRVSEARDRGNAESAG